MPVGRPSPSSPVLGSGQQVPTWPCWAALHAEVTSFSLAHTDIYWAWAATGNELAAVVPK